uniref:Mitochondria-eating protein n=1 Tax=Cacopsylla melanoneura TaxID=428564 RepID=A0A8D8Z4Y0_9HEMI
MNRYYEAYPRRSGLLTLPPPPLDTPSKPSSTILMPSTTASITNGGVENTATWNSYNSEPIQRNNLLERIKPERERTRLTKNISKLQWKQQLQQQSMQQQYNSFDMNMDMFGSMTINDVSPRFALKRILLLYENLQYREVANFINRLSHNTFKIIINQLPIDLFIEQIPNSLNILEALFGKIFLSSHFNGIKLLKPENVLLQIVRIFVNTSNNINIETYIGSIRKLIKVIVLSEPKLRKTLQLRKRILDKAVEGLGQHGLVGTSDETLTNLHDALKVEFQKLVDTYKQALSKLEELSLSGKINGVIKGPAPVNQSHQRQLSLKQNDIQERLIKNKTLLNVIEPVLENKSMAILLTIMQRRVEYDKDVLFQFTQLRKQLNVDEDYTVAPLLMKYSHSIHQVLDLMKEVAEDDGGDSSDISGYHSDSDSAIMMSGNSPYVTKRARHNFLTRSVRSGSNRSGRTGLVLSGASSSESPPDIERGPNWGDWSTTTSTTSPADKPSSVSASVDRLTSITASIPSCPTCVDARNGLHTGILTQQNTHKEIVALQGELETTKKELELARAKIESLSKTIQTQASTKELSGTRLIRCYGNLYSQARVDALETLDGLPQLREAAELKSKILFSVVVLAFRSTFSIVSQKKDHIRRLLLNPAPVSSAHMDLENAVASFLRKTVDTFDLTHCIEEVSSQLWATLYDYPCLKSCSGLQQYIRDSVRLAWALVNQSPPFVLEYEQRTFKRDNHVRFHTSKTDSDVIKTYLWLVIT